VVVEALRHQLQGEGVLLAGRFLDLGPLVLEPDLDLGLVEAQLGAQLLPPPLGQVAVFREFVLEAGQLRPRERRPRPLLLGRGGTLLRSGFLHAPGPGTWNDDDNLVGAIDAVSKEMS
jgi:hypothetical protein